MNNEYKDELQRETLSSLKGETHIILKWATGAGKSKMTILLLKQMRVSRVLLLVAEKAHIKNWKEEFKKWDYDGDMEILCYASMHKMRGTHWDCLILDEGHHVFTSKRMSYLENIWADNIIMLSATLKDENRHALEDIYGKFEVSTVTLKDAIKHDILPDPKIYVIGLSLDEKNHKEKILNGKPKNKKDLPSVYWEDRMDHIYSKTPCWILATEKQKYIWYSDIMEYWKQRYQRSHNEFHKNRWVNLGSVRKRYLAQLKTSYAKDLVERLNRKHRRYICFCGSVEQCQSLGSENAIHSKRTNNQEIIDLFNDKKIDSLFAVGMANEGVNLSDIQTGVIIQLDGNERQFIQKMGRALRAEQPEVYIFYFYGTQDEKYLKNALEKVDNKFVKRMDIDMLRLMKI